MMRYTILSDRRSYRPTEAALSVEFSHRRFGPRITCKHAQDGSYLRQRRICIVLVAAP